MALDHYVSQVHLRKFYNAEKVGLIAFNKDTGRSKLFTSKQVCRTDEGNTNEYLTEPRAVEEFLKPIENGYNDAVETLQAGKINGDSVYVIGGFVAYVITCSPAAMRMHKAMMEGILRSTTKLLDAHGAFPDPPGSLPGKSATELIESGAIKIEVDNKFPQAIGITNVQTHVGAFGNSHWEIFLNNTDTPFFTSDYPIAIEPNRPTGTMSRTIPLAPDLAVRINPDRDVKRFAHDMQFRRLSNNVVELSRHQVVEINRKLVQCAERLVFSNHERDWIAPFVVKNRNFRVEINETSIPNARGVMMVTNQNIMPFSRPEIIQ